MNADLIKRAKTDVDAFGELYEAFYDSVYRFTYLRVNDQALCEDLVSQVWEKVLTHLHTLKSDAPEAFRAWIFTLTCNCIAEHFRRHKEALLPEDWDSAGPDSPQQDFTDKELGEAIRLALQGLPALEREIVSLKVFGDLSNKDIAKLLGKQENSIGAYLSRALKHVQKRLSLYSPSL